MAGWLVVCAFAGAAAALGLLEFDLGGPPYDGGFIGFYVLSGLLFSAAQAPFVALFLGRFVFRFSSGLFWTVLMAVLSAAAWAVAGAIGWTLTSVLLFPWIGMGVMQSMVLFALLSAFSLSREVSDSPRFGKGLASLIVSCLLWMLTTVAGGALVTATVALLETYWWSGSHSGIDGSGVFGLPQSGSLENITEIVIPMGLVVAVLYGSLTSLVLVRIYRKNAGVDVPHA